MNPTQMIAEMNKLNPRQRRALRGALFGRGLASLISVDEKTGKATVEFQYDGKRIAHWIMLGQRGRIVYHEVACIA